MPSPCLSTPLRSPFRLSNAVFYLSVSYHPNAKRRRACLDSVRHIPLHLSISFKGISVHNPSFIFCCAQYSMFFVRVSTIENIFVFTLLTSPLFADLNPCELYVLPPSNTVTPPALMGNVEKSSVCMMDLHAKICRIYRSHISFAQSVSNLFAGSHVASGSLFGSLRLQSIVFTNIHSPRNTYAPVS